MKTSTLLSIHICKLLLRRENYARLAMLALLVGLLALPAYLGRLAPACQPEAGAACSASAGFKPHIGLAQPPFGKAPTSSDILANSPYLLTNLPPTISSFITFALPYALQAHKALGWQTSVILAQWGLEVGWHVPTYTGYNWGNVGAMPGVPTVPGTSAPGSPPAFSYAASPADGVRIYIMAARLPYYDQVFQAVPYGAVDTAVALGRSPWDAGHYTNRGQPGSSLLDIMQRYHLLLLDDLLASLDENVR